VSGLVSELLWIIICNFCCFVDIGVVMKQVRESDNNFKKGLQISPAGGHFIEFPTENVFVENFIGRYQSEKGL